MVNYILWKSTEFNIKPMIMKVDMVFEVTSVINKIFYKY